MGGKNIRVLHSGSRVSLTTRYSCIRDSGIVIMFRKRRRKNMKKGWLIHASYLWRNYKYHEYFMAIWCIMRERIGTYRVLWKMYIRVRPYLAVRELESVVTFMALELTFVCSWVNISRPRLFPIYTFPVYVPNFWDVYLSIFIDTEEHWTLTFLRTFPFSHHGVFNFCSAAYLSSK